MKIVHSFWSKPFLADKTQNQFSRSSGGWSDRRFHYMSWALSCLNFKKFYSHVQLVTDAYGKYILVDLLKLPYTEVTVCLDQLSGYDAMMWALPKIHAYSLQEEPFIHADGDVFIWKPFPQRITESPLIAQHLEINYPLYQDAYDQLVRSFDIISEDILIDRKTNREFKSANAGIFGGREIGFFKKYTAEALRLIDANKAHLRKIDQGQFNIIFEQYLFYCMAKSNDIHIEYYFNDIGAYFENLTRFAEIPLGTTGYIHPIGSTKTRADVGFFIENALRINHSEYYHNIVRLLHSSKL